MSGRLVFYGESLLNSPVFCVSRQMQHDSTPQGELRKGPVGVYRMEHLHPKNSDLEELDRFPGPLHDGVAEEAVL